MLTKIQRRIQSKYSHNYKFALHPILIKRNIICADNECFMCDTGVLVPRFRIASGFGRIRILTHYHQCNTCKGSVVRGNSTNHNTTVRVFSKVYAALKKWGPVRNKKRITRKCKFTLHQWYSRCDRIDNGWRMGEVQAYFRR